MTKEETLKAAEVMRRWANGEAVECIIRSLDDEWTPHPSPYWNWERCDYRIAEALKYRPWTADEVPVGAVVRSKETKLASMISFVTLSERLGNPKVCIFDNLVSTDILLERYEMLDGSPCGVKV